MQGPGATAKKRRALLTALAGSYGEVAAGGSGSHFVEKCYALAVSEATLLRLFSLSFSFVHSGSLSLLLFLSFFLLWRGWLPQPGSVFVGVCVSLSCPGHHLC